MKKSTELTPASDADLFRQALQGVTPIATDNRKAASPARPASPPRLQQHIVAVSDNWSDHQDNDVAPTSFLRNGLNNMTLRKLRRGQWPVQDSIDLHGLTSDEARILLASFLQQVIRNNYRCVSVIHGKGWRAEGVEGILKIRVRHWLTQHPQVLAFCEAPAHAGGGGAVWLLLKTGS